MSLFFVILKVPSVIEIFPQHRLNQADFIQEFTRNQLFSGVIRLCNLSLGIYIHQDSHIWKWLAKLPYYCQKCCIHQIWDIDIKIIARYVKDLFELRKLNSMYKLAIKYIRDFCRQPIETENHCDIAANNKFRESALQQINFFARLDKKQYKINFQLTVISLPRLVNTNMEILLTKKTFSENDVITWLPSF